VPEVVTANAGLARGCSTMGPGAGAGSGAAVCAQPASNRPSSVPASIVAGGEDSHPRFATPEFAGGRGRQSIVPTFM
jgi:hypothetical protein